MKRSLSTPAAGANPLAGWSAVPVRGFHRADFHKQANIKGVAQCE